MWMSPEEIIYFYEERVFRTNMQRRVAEWKQKRLFSVNVSKCIGMVWKDLERT